MSVSSIQNLKPESVKMTGSHQLRLGQMRFTASSPVRDEDGFGPGSLRCLAGRRCGDVREPLQRTFAELATPGHGGVRMAGGSHLNVVRTGSRKTSSCLPLSPFTLAETRRFCPRPTVSGICDPARWRSFVTFTSLNWKFGPVEDVSL